MGLRRFHVTTILGLAMFLWGCTESVEPSQGVSSHDEVDIVAIYAFFERYDQSLKDGAIEDFLSMLTDDVIMMGPDKPPVVGRQAVRRNVTPLFKELEIVHRVTVKELRLAGDWAYVRANYWFRGTAKSGGEVTEDFGKAIYLVERQPDNSWKLATDCYNTDHPTTY